MLANALRCEAHSRARTRRPPDPTKSASARPAYSQVTSMAWCWAVSTCASICCVMALRGSALKLSGERQSRHAQECLAGVCQGSDRRWVCISEPSVMTEQQRELSIRLFMGIGITTSGRTVLSSFERKYRPITTETLFVLNVQAWRRPRFLLGKVATLSARFSSGVPIEELQLAQINRREGGIAQKSDGIGVHIF